MAFLVLRGLAKRYGAIDALVGIDLAAEEGSRIVVVGPSGSGKTTLLRLIAGFEMPDRGTIALGGDLLADGPSGIPVHRRGIAYVPQDGALFPHLSVAQNIGFGLARSSGDRDRRIAELMDLVELDPALRSRAPHQLSGGQQQRVALARGLARKPRLVLLDEPFSALDANLRDSVRRSTARALRAAGVTTILVTHDRMEALSFADDLVVLARGLIAEAGPPRELYLRPYDRETGSFLGEAIILTATLADGWAECALGRLRVVGDVISGEAEIMLRPEQVALIPTVAGSPSPAPLAEVVEVEFGGATTLVTVALAGYPDPAKPGATITVRVASSGAPAVGARLEASVSGVAHVLATVGRTP